MGINSIFAATTIVDRTGRRVGTYIVDRSKDPLERDQKGAKKDARQEDQAAEEEAVVMHGPPTEDGKRASVELNAEALTGLSALNITV
jgi:hypothetical protein